MQQAYVKQVLTTAQACIVPNKNRNFSSYSLHISEFVCNICLQNCSKTLDKMPSYRLIQTYTGLIGFYSLLLHVSAVHIGHLHEWLWYKKKERREATPLLFLLCSSAVSNNS